MIKGVWEEEIKNEDLYLKWDSSLNTILFYLVDSSGHKVDCGYLFDLDKKTGKIIRRAGVNTSLGLDLDPSGEIKIG